MSTPRRPEPRSSAAPMTATERAGASTGTAASAYAARPSARLRRREAQDSRRRKHGLAQLVVHGRAGEHDDRERPAADPRGGDVVAHEGADLTVGHPVEPHRPRVQAYGPRPRPARVRRTDDVHVGGRAREPEA